MLAIDYLYWRASWVFLLEGFVQHRILLRSRDWEIVLNEKKKNLSFYQISSTYIELCHIIVYKYCCISQIIFSYQPVNFFIGLTNISKLFFNTSASRASALTLPSKYTLKKFCINHNFTQIIFNSIQYIFKYNNNISNSSVEAYSRLKRWRSINMTV